MALDRIRLRGEEINLASIDLVVGDITKGMEQIAAQIAYAGSLWATAEMESEEADAAYRNWRATYAKKIAESGDKMAEWKVVAEIESSAGFMKCKEAIAIAKRNTVVLRTLCDALKAKAGALQSRGAMLRAELETTGMHTKERDPDAPRRRTSLTAAEISARRRASGVPILTDDEAPLPEA